MVMRKFDEWEGNTMRSFWDFIKVMVGVKPQTVKPDVYRLSREEEIPRGTRKEQVLWELGRDMGTARQLSLRMNLKLSIVRVTLTSLHKEGFIRDTGKNVGVGREAENLWEVVAMPTWEITDG